MMRRLVLVLGGVRSGKSRFAQQLAERLAGESVLFVATAEAGDEEMRHRIDHHRRSRPAAWKTMEQPLEVGGAICDLASTPRVILIDCLTLLVSNALLRSGGQMEVAQQHVRREVEGLVGAADHHGATMIIVSGEVGQGLVPESPLGRAFRDLLGWANQMLAEQAEATYLMVAGLAVDVRPLARTVDEAAGQVAPGGRWAL